MKVEFFDRQDPANLLNGTTIEDITQLRRALRAVRGRSPFFAELVGDNGFKLLLGLAAENGCAQFGSVDGSPPYLMALIPGAVHPQGHVEFLMGGTATPVPARYCVPSETLLDVAATFVRTGKRNQNVQWEEI